MRPTACGNHANRRSAFGKGTRSADGAVFAQRVSDLADVALRGLAQSGRMLPLSDGLTARRFPIMNVSLALP
jgi:hypothetical protein